MEIKGALTMVNESSKLKAESSKEDERFYIQCPKRKDKGKVPATKCLLKCDYGIKEGNRVRCGYFKPGKK